MPSVASGMRMRVGMRKCLQMPGIVSSSKKDLWGGVGVGALTGARPPPVGPAPPPSPPPTPSAAVGRSEVGLGSRLLGSRLADSRLGLGARL